MHKDVNMLIDNQQNDQVMGSAYTSYQFTEKKTNKQKNHKTKPKTWKIAHHQTTQIINPR